MNTAGISNVEVARRDIYALGYPPASFDAVVAGNVLHLVPDLERALDALCRVLRPGESSSPPPSCMTRHEPRGWCLASWR